MKFVLSGAFGELSEIRGGRIHNGIDIAMPEGTELRAIGNAVIEKVFDYGTQNAGKGVVLRLEDGTRAVYGHMNEITVSKGDVIHYMDTLGYSGNTGLSSGPHLHFSLQAPSGEYIDPTPFYDGITSITGNNGINQGFWGWFTDRGQVDQYSDAAQESPGWFWEWVGNGLENGLADLGHWFILNLPDFMGYLTILAGVCIILGAMFGKGGMIKPLAVYAALLILSLCILGGV